MELADEDLGRLRGSSLKREGQKEAHQQPNDQREIDLKAAVSHTRF